MELQQIHNKIYVLRGHKVMIDHDLAELYETETKRLKEAVRRNIKRFPPDFMFELTSYEFESLRTQFATLDNQGRGKHSKYLPFAFTEQGVAMLASVLRSDKAIEVNIAIVRAFVLLRQHLTDFQNLQQQILALEEEMNIKFKDITEAMNYLLQKDQLQISQEERKRIGF